MVVLILVIFLLSDDRRKAIPDVISYYLFLKEGVMPALVKSTNFLTLLEGGGRKREISNI